MYDTTLKNTVTSPSAEFTAFIAQYFEGHMYIQREEYDLDLPSKLQGAELQVAKSITTANILTDKSNMKQLLYLAFVFNLRDLIPFLKTRFESDVREDAKVYIGLLLYKWGELDSFIAYCKIILGTKNGEFDHRGITDAKMAIIDITYTSFHEAYLLNTKESLELLLLALRDSDLHLRDTAFWNICLTYRKDYRDLNIFEKLDKSAEDKKYYIENEVYNNKELFEKRLKELENTLV